MKNLVLTFILLVLLKLSTANTLKQCPDYQIHFEKILGFRPPPVLSQTYGAPLGEKILYKYFHQVPSVINLSCMELCKNDINCDGYVLNFNKSECYGYTSNERQLDVHNFRQADDHELVEDINVVYFVKTCLSSESILFSCTWRIPKILRLEEI